MTHTILISIDDAAVRIGDPAWLFVDCRYTLGDPGKGRRDYDAGHLPGAIFASLDDDLASPHVPGRTGRHPLPEKSAWLDTLSGWGIAPATQIVAYDGGVGQSAAGRLWWMLKWAGHDRVAVLDGGLPRWVETGNLLTTDPPSHRQNRRFEPRWRDDMQVSAAEVAARLAAGSATVLDARAIERFRGEAEPFDPVAGRVPGATNRPVAQNLAKDGTFKPVADLRDELAAMLGSRDAAQVIHMCGSGVTACHNMLAMAIAGFPAGRLYAGSWSEWCADPARPVAKGP